MAIAAKKSRSFLIESFCAEKGHRNSVFRTGPVVKCRKCGTVEGFDRRKPEDAPEAYFLRLGWKLGAGVYMDLCPDCASGKPEKAGKPMKDMKSIAATLQANKPGAPREITREERQRIHAKIGEHYLDTGYDPPWTDRAIAEAEKVPMAWVSAIRDQFYGPEGSNPLFDKFEKDASAFVDSYNELSAVKGQIDALEIMGREIMDMLKKIKQETRGIAR